MTANNDQNYISVKHINARSICNKTSIIRDLILENSVDILSINETWLSDSDGPIIAACLPDTHSFHHCPRAEGRGGGVALILSKKFKQVKSYQRRYRFFECLQLKFLAESKPFTIFSIYRPPGPSSLFFSEFEQFLLESQTESGHIFYIGDFNFWVDDARNSDSQNFLQLIGEYNLINHVTGPTYESGHTLDLVITGASMGLLRNLRIEPVCTISDHRLISFNIDVSISTKYEKKIKFRRPDSSLSDKLKLSLESFLSDVSSRNCIHSAGSMCVDCFNELFRHTAYQIFNDYAPVIEKTIKVSDRSNLWYNGEINLAKRKLRKAEKNFVRNKCDRTRAEFVRLRREKDRVIINAKKQYYCCRIEASGSDSKKLQREINNLLGKNINSNHQLPDYITKSQLLNDFKDFFISKVESIMNSFQPIHDVPKSMLPDYPVKRICNFSPVSAEKKSNYLSKMNKTFCLNDPIDIRMIDFGIAGGKMNEALCEIVNLSFQSGIFPISEKFSYIRPLLKANKNPNEFSSYRPLYNTSFVSKILEYAAIDQLKSHLNAF